MTLTRRRRETESLESWAGKTAKADDAFAHASNGGVASARGLRR